MNKTILATIVIAFLAGTVITSSLNSAYAAQDPFSTLITALNSIKTAITGIHPTVNVSPTPITINAPAGPQGPAGPKGDKGEPGNNADITALQSLVEQSRCSNLDQYADLHGCNLSGFSPRQGVGIDLRFANLSGANLSGDDFHDDPYMYNINFHGADLHGADLHGTVLSHSDFSGANLSGANLLNTDSGFADFSGANISGAKLGQSNFQGAIFTGCTGIPIGIPPPC